MSTDYSEEAAEHGTPFMKLSLDTDAAGTTGFDVYDDMLRRYVNLASHRDRPTSLTMDVETYRHHEAVEEAEQEYEAAKDLHTDSETIRERLETGIDILRAYSDLRETKKLLEHGELPGTKQVTRITPEEPGIPVLSLGSDAGHEYVAVAGEDTFDLYFVDRTSGDEIVQEDWRSAFIENAAESLAEEYGDDAVALEPAF